MIVADAPLGVASGIEIGRVHEVSSAVLIFIEHGERRFVACPRPKSPPNAMVPRQYGLTHKPERPHMP